LDHSVTCFFLWSYLIFLFFSLALHVLRIILKSRFLCFIVSFMLLFCAFPLALINITVSLLFPSMLCLFGFDGGMWLAACGLDGI
jgi:hypothetical protein